MISLVIRAGGQAVSEQGYVTNRWRWDGKVGFPESWSQQMYGSPIHAALEPTLKGRPAHPIGATMSRDYRRLGSYQAWVSGSTLYRSDPTGAVRALCPTPSRWALLRDGAIICQLDEQVFLFPRSGARATAISGFNAPWFIRENSVLCVSDDRTVELDVRARTWHSRLRPGLQRYVPWMKYLAGPHGRIWDLQDWTSPSLQVGHDIGVSVDDSLWTVLEGELISVSPQLTVSRHGPAESVHSDRRGRIYVLRDDGWSERRSGDWRAVAVPRMADIRWPPTVSPLPDGTLIGDVTVPFPADGAVLLPGGSVICWQDGGCVIRFEAVSHKIDTSYRS